MPLTYTSVDHIVPNSTPLYVNASLLKISSCSFRIYLTHSLGYKLKLDPEIPAAGTALHKFCSDKDTGVDHTMAVANALSIAPQNPKLRATLMALMNCKQPDHPPIVAKNGELFVEQRVEIPWRLYTINGKSYTIVLHGTLDRIICINDVLVIQDYKTSHYYKDEDALRKYEYEIQFEFYKWLCYEFGHSFLTLAHANLARQCKLLSQPIVAKMNEKAARWIHGPQRGFTPTKAGLIEELVTSFVEETLLPLQDATYVPQSGMLSNSCAHCDFRDICHCENEPMKQTLLNANFKQVPYGEKRIRG